MSVSNDSTGISTIDDGRALLSSSFLDFCAKVRNNDPSILPAPGESFKIRRLCEREGIELADALLENNSVTYLELEMVNYTKSSAEAMAEYVRTSKHLQRIRWNGRRCDDMLCCFLPAIQESTSLKELHMDFLLIGGPSSLAFEHILTHTQSLRSLTLICSAGRLDDIAVAVARSGLKKNTTLQELTLDVSTTDVSSILTSLRDHPFLRRLCLCEYTVNLTVNLTGLETVLLSDNSKITELEIVQRYGGRPLLGLTHVLQALGRRPTLTKLRLRGFPLGHDEVRQLGMVLRNTPSLQTLALTFGALGSAELAELSPAVHHNTSIKALDISANKLIDLESTGLLRGIIRCNTTLTSIDLTGNQFGRTTGAVGRIAEGLGSNSTLLNIDLSS
jgi:Leucine-rich repeat (LRR) protein